MSANQNQKMMRQINEYKMKIEENEAENATMKDKINKLSGENVNLSEEVKVAQDNLRLSANNMAKMKNEIRNLTIENEELKKKLNSSTGNSRKVEELEEKVILLSTEIKRLRSGETEHEGTKQKLL